MNKDKEIEDLLLKNLMAIIDYTNGSKNLEEAKESLRKSGFEDKNIDKVLKDIDRKNIIKFPQQK
jgi:hypothetical protein